jgi:hypothetical protein
MPVLIAGNAIDFKLFSSATVKLLRTALRNKLSASVGLCSLQTGPTAWMTNLASSFPPLVMTASLVDSGPSFSMSVSDSCWMAGPPLREIAAATPPPCFRYPFAAFTTPSTGSVVMSPCTISSVALPMVFFIAWNLYHKTVSRGL